MQKTVLYIGGFELPDKNAAAQRVIANAKILKSLGYIVVFISVDKTMENEEPIMNTISFFEGFTYFRIKYPKSFYEWLNYLVSIKSIIDLQFINPSILIAYNYPAFALMRLKKYCNNKNICILADCTEWYEAIGNIVFKVIKGLDVYLRMQIIHPKLDGLIVISDYLYDFYKAKIKNLLLLPPLVDLEQNKWTLNSNKNNKIVLVYAGSIGNGGKDRLDLIIRILSEIKKSSPLAFIFNIVGLSKTEYLKLFGNETLPLNIDEFVSFKGRLSHVETLKEIVNSDYQLFVRDPNLTNKAGFPTKYVESISCGIPVLTNSSDSIKNYFISGKTGFSLDLSSDDHLKNSLLKAMSLDKEQIHEMKAYCKSSLLFSITHFVSPFKEFLSKMGM